MSDSDRIQREAADPAFSTAVRAAAGSGKTRVLVDRVVRLLLEGAAPQSIVAVTFTRKAAAEIKERLLGILRELAAADEAARRRKLEDLLGRPPEPHELSRAAALYDLLLEDLAGLPIGTIHSWCQRLLTRFAAEIGLDPRFTVLERPEELWAETLDRLESEAAADPATRLALASLAPKPTDARARLTRLCVDRPALERWLARVREAASEPAAPLDLLLADLRAALFAGTALEGLPDPDATAVAPLVERAAAVLAAGARALRAGAAYPLPKKMAGALDGLAGAPEAAARFASAKDPRARAAAQADLRKLVLTDKAELRSLGAPKDGKARAQLAFAEAARPLLEALVLSDLVELYRDNAALLRFGLRAQEIYDRLKLRDRCLDFHDLERRARHLMVESEQAPLIQYRLDARVDHLLIDEFQDTNYDQWEILEPLADEFLAGEGARAGGRTLFIVGDVKQSIYRFRGAEPRLFDLVEAELAERERDDEGRERTRRRVLPSNFRSLPELVEGIGTLFGAEPLASRLPPRESGRVRQTPERSGRGEVRVLPVLGPEGASRRDALRYGAAEARRIVARLRAEAPPVFDKELRGERPLRCGDVLVLCRSRTHVGAYEQALRAASIPIVPSGRGALARSREAQDVLQLLRWLVFPRDDLALACVLRSPLLRVNEQTFQRLLADRLRLGPGVALWNALRRRHRPLGLTREVGLLEEWRRFVDLEGCHDLLRRVYRGSAALERYALSDLGEQARYNLLRLHDLALELDQRADSSPRRFAAMLALAAQTSAEEEAAPPPEEGEGRVQLLTVHGAKGLESPVVLLVDAAAPLRQDADRLALAGQGEDTGAGRGLPRSAARGPALVYGARRFLTDGPGLPEGAPPLRVEILHQAAVAARSAMATEEADVLYVAMTRARDRLYVLGSRAGSSPDRPSYLDWLGEAAARLPDSERADLPVQFEALQWPEEEQKTEPAAGAAGSRAESSDGKSEYEMWEPKPLRERARLVSPSGPRQAPEEADPSEAALERRDGAWDAVVESAAAGSATPADAAARGTAIHLWLRLAAEPGGIPAEADAGGAEAAAADALAEARAVAGNPALAWIFHPEREGRRGLSEAPIIHQRPPDEADGVPVRVYGVIDRLIVGDRRVEIVDYKSNRIEATAGSAALFETELSRLVEFYRPQLEAYRAAAAALFPDREIGAHILFTHAKDAAARQGRLIPL